VINAFAESRNIPALKLAARVGIQKVVDMVHRFGVTSPVPLFLPVAIGAADLTLYEQVGSYSVFPNDGIRLAPHYIRKVTTTDGMSIQEQDQNAAVQVVIDVQTARTMMQLLQAVVQHGTGMAALQLKHPLGGKTGTTNDFTDAWFIGFSPSVTCGTWVGFDDPSRTLGDKETGAHAALPIWMDFMRVAIADKPNEVFPADDMTKNQPVTVDTSPKGSTGSIAPAKPPAAVPQATAASGATGGVHPVAVKPVMPKPVVPATGSVTSTSNGRTGVSHPTDETDEGSAAPAAHPAQSAPSAPPH